MRNKVLYISVFLAFFFLNTGYAQKTNLSLLPSSETELKLYKMEEGSIEKAETSTKSSSSMDVNTYTPNIKHKRRSSRSKEHRLCRMIGLVCKKQWSAGMIKLFSLPAATDSRIY